MTRPETEGIGAGVIIKWLGSSFPMGGWWHANLPILRSTKHEEVEGAYKNQCRSYTEWIFCCFKRFFGRATSASAFSSRSRPSLIRSGSFVAPKGRSAGLGIRDNRVPLRKALYSWLFHLMRGHPIRGSLIIQPLTFFDGS